MSNECMKILVIIPAWNEEAVLGQVLEGVRAELPSEIDMVVVSDGSTDNTALIARSQNIPVLDLPINLGVGGAMRAGYLYAYRQGYTHVIQLDADGQHDPREVPALIKAMRKENADIVIGARFAGKGTYRVRGPRKWAMTLLSAVLSRVCRTKLTYTTSGFIVYGPRAVSLFSRNYPAEYLGDTIEALIIAARSRLVITQVGVEMHPRAGGEASHNPFKAALYLIRAFVALFVALSRPRTDVAFLNPLPVHQSGEEAR